MTSPVQYFSLGNGSGGNGEIGVGTSQIQGPAQKCRMAIFYADADNTGNVYVGFATGVTAADGTTDTTTGICLDAGRDTGWLPVANLDDVFFISDTASQSVTYAFVS